MAREPLAPVRPSLAALLAERSAPWYRRRPLARAVAEVIAQRKPYAWARALEYVLLRTTDLPHARRRKRDPMSGKIIEESAEQTRAYEQAKATGANGNSTPTSPEQVELNERRAGRTRQREQARERWLDSSGFAVVIEKAEALIEDLPRAHEEHQAAQRTLPELATFRALAAEVPADAVLERYARRAADLAQTIARPPTLFENAAALRELIARVKAADLDGANGPVKNSNVATAWMRQFRELVSPLPQPGHAESCRKQVKVFLAEARDAREGRTA